MTKLPSAKLSVIVPLYNKRDEVARALTSVLRQTIAELDIIVVDDGSTDGGADVVKAFADPRVRLVRQANAGASAARNRGVSEAASELVAFLDADDEWAPEFAFTTLRLADRYPDCALLATAYWRVYPDGRSLTLRLRGLPFAGDDGVVEDYFSVAADSDPLVCSSAVAVRKSALQQVGGFPEGVFPGEDLLTWARLAALYPLAYSREPLASFHAPRNVSERLPRPPQTPDVVSEGLHQLMETATPALLEGMRRYLSLWHRMRAVIYIQLNLPRLAQRELGVARATGGRSRSLVPYSLLTRLPARMPALTFEAVRALKRRWQAVRPWHRRSHGARKKPGLGPVSARECNGQNLCFYRNVNRTEVYELWSDAASHPLFKEVSSFVSHFDLDGQRVLEIGSGKGLFQDLVADYTGVDVSERLDVYYHKPYVVVESARLPFADGSFDAVMACDTHEHIPDLELSLEEIARVLKPGGVCLMAPAWYTRLWFASGLAVRDWRGLTATEKLLRATIPVRDAFLVRATIALVRRLVALTRWYAGVRPFPLLYRKLNANYEAFWQSDSDACNSLDPFLLLLWFRSRGFLCPSHPSIVRALFLRGSALILEKERDGLPPDRRG